MEAADSVGAVVGRGMAFGAALLGPARPCGGADAERSELVECEDAVGAVVQDLFDAVELGVAVGVRRVFPGLGALEGEAAAGDEAP